MAILLPDVRSCLMVTDQLHCCSHRLGPGRGGGEEAAEVTEERSATTTKATPGKDLGPTRNGS